MTNLYLLSEIAEQDIEEIITYIAQENLTAAYDFIDALYKTFDMLAEHPFMGHLREDLTDHPVRFWSFKWRYLIIYKSTQPLEIARVLSGFRDIYRSRMKMRKSSCHGGSFMIKYTHGKKVIIRRAA